MRKDYGVIFKGSTLSMAAIVGAFTDFQRTQDIHLTTNRLKTKKTKLSLFSLKMTYGISCNYLRQLGLSFQALLPGMLVSIFLLWSIPSIQFKEWNDSAYSGHGGHVKCMVMSSDFTGAEANEANVHCSYI